MEATTETRREAELGRRMDAMGMRADRLRREIRDLRNEFDDVADIARSDLYDRWGVDPLVDDDCPSDAVGTFDAYHEARHMADALAALMKVHDALV